MAFPRDLSDIIPKTPIEVIDLHGKPHWVLGLLDTGTLIGTGIRSKVQPDGLIDSETPDKL